MINIVIPSLYLLAGVCAYATLIHLSAGLRRPFDLTHIIFGCMCLLMAPFAITHASTLQATDISQLTVALKWNLAIVLVVLALLPWFIAQYTGKYPRPFLLGLTALFAVLSIVNFMAPYSLQYAHISEIRILHMPWGETITHAQGINGGWFYIGALGVMVDFGYGLYALGNYYRRHRSHTSLGLILAIGILLMGSIEGILVRLSIIDTVETGPLGYLAMVIAMSMVLSHETQQKLRTSERRFRSLVEQSPFSIQILAPNGHTRQVNPAWEKLWGLKGANLEPYNIRQDHQLMEKGVMPLIEKGFNGEAAELPAINYNPADNPVARGPTNDRWVRAHIYPIKDEAGAINDVVLVHEDVTEKKHIEDAIRLIAAGVTSATGEHFFQQLMQSLAKLFNADYAFIGLMDEHNPQKVNTLAVCAHGEIVPDLTYELTGTPCANVMGKSTCAYPNNVQNLFPEDKLLLEMGAESYIGTPLFDAQGKPLGLIVILDSNPIEDIEHIREILEIFAARASAELQRLRAEKHIRRMAFEDYLTGLASRAYVHERLSESLDQTRRSRESGALLLIDLDHFKTINDALSHDVGDEVLRSVGRRLKEVAGEQVLVGRMGGDEFAALINVKTANKAEAEIVAQGLAQKIVDKLLNPICVGERAFTVGASIGVVIFPENGETELDVLRHAEMALYRAKSRGRGNTQFYLPALQAAATSRLQLEEGLRRVIANDELSLFFQPQVDAEGNLIGAEALLRWRHPEMGDIQPATFIPIAEETGLIHPIGQWVIDQACGYLSAWREAGVPFVGHLSVNVCPWQFIRPDFVSQVRESILTHQVDPHQLMLELTETALLYDLGDTIQKLEMLRAMGLQIALDDFGTGYSSLAYLKDLPLDQIKIDQAFVAELKQTGKYPLVESMISIGRHMRLKVIAEGVETEMQRDILVQLGCENFQGYLFSRPLPEKEFMQWLSEKNATTQSENSKP